MARFRIEQRPSDKRRLSGSGPKFDWVIVDRLKPQDVKQDAQRGAVCRQRTQLTRAG
jgi:hypothetical protein